MNKFHVITIIMTLWCFSYFYTSFEALLFREMGLSIYGICIIFSIFNIVALFADPIFGKLCDKIGRRKMLISGLFTRSIVPVLYAIVFYIKTRIFLVGVRIAHAISHSFLSPSEYTYLQDVIKKKYSPSSFGLYRSSTRIGLVLSSVIGGVIASKYGIPAAFILSSISMFIIFIIANFALKDTFKPKRKKKISVDLDVSGDFEEYFSYRKTLVALGILAICISIFTETRLIIYPLFAVESGISLIEIGAFFGAVEIFMIFSQYIFGLLENRIGIKAPIFIAYIIITLSVFLLSFANSFLLMISSALLYSLGIAIATPARLSLLRNSVPDKKRGQFNGVYLSLGCLGAIIGPFMVIFLVFLGYSFSFIFLATGTILAIGTVISGILLKLQPLPQIVTKIKI